MDDESVHIDVETPSLSDSDEDIEQSEGAPCTEELPEHELVQSLAETEKKVEQKPKQGRPAASEAKPHSSKKVDSVHITVDTPSLSDSGEDVSDGPPCAGDTVRRQSVSIEVEPEIQDDSKEGPDCETKTHSSGEVDSSPGIVDVEASTESDVGDIERDSSTEVSGLMTESPSCADLEKDIPPKVLSKSQSVGELGQRSTKALLEVPSQAKSRSSGRMERLCRRSRAERIVMTKSRSTEAVERVRLQSRVDLDVIRKSDSHEQRMASPEVSRQDEPSTSGSGDPNVADISDSDDPEDVCVGTDAEVQTDDPNDVCVGTDAEAQTDDPEDVCVGTDAEAQTDDPEDVCVGTDAEAQTDDPVPSTSGICKNLSRFRIEDDYTRPASEAGPFGLPPESKGGRPGKPEVRGLAGNVPEFQDDVFELREIAHEPELDMYLSSDTDSEISLQDNALAIPQVASHTPEIEEVGGRVDEAELPHQDFNDLDDDSRFGYCLCGGLAAVGVALFSFMMYVFIKGL